MNDLRPMVIIAIGLRMRNWQFQDTDVSSKPKKCTPAEKFEELARPHTPGTAMELGTTWTTGWVAEAIGYGYGFSLQIKIKPSPAQFASWNPFEFAFWTRLLYTPSKDAGDYWILYNFYHQFLMTGKNKQIEMRLISFEKWWVLHNAQLAWQLHIWNR